MPPLLGALERVKFAVWPHLGERPSARSPRARPAARQCELKTDFLLGELAIALPFAPSGPLRARPPLARSLSGSRAKLAAQAGRVGNERLSRAAAVAARPSLCWAGLRCVARLEASANEVDQRQERTRKGTRAERLDERPAPSSTGASSAPPETIGDALARALCCRGTTSESGRRQPPPLVAASKNRQPRAGRAVHFQGSPRRRHGLRATNQLAGPLLV
jgi:hypothetical protein